MARQWQAINDGHFVEDLALGVDLGDINLYDASTTPNWRTVFADLSTATHETFERAFRWICYKFDLNEEVDYDGRFLVIGNWLFGLLIHKLDSLSPGERSPAVDESVGHLIAAGAKCLHDHTNGYVPNALILLSYLDYNSDQVSLIDRVLSTFPHFNETLFFDNQTMSLFQFLRHFYSRPRHFAAHASGYRALAADLQLPAAATAADGATDDAAVAAGGGGWQQQPRRRQRWVSGYTLQELVLATLRAGGGGGGGDGGSGGVEVGREADCAALWLQISRAWRDGGGAQGPAPPAELLALWEECGSAIAEAADAIVQAQCEVSQAAATLQLALARLRTLQCAPLRDRNRCAHQHLTQQQGEARRLFGNAHAEMCGRRLAAQQRLQRSNAVLSQQLQQQHDADMTELQQHGAQAVAAAQAELAAAEADRDALGDEERRMRAAMLQRVEQRSQQLDIKYADEKATMEAEVAKASRESDAAVAQQRAATAKEVARLARRVEHYEAGIRIRQEEEAERLGR